jgi:hypothetical protein
MSDPVRIPIDDDGQEVQDISPSTPFQQRLLKAVGRKWFQTASDKRKAEKLEEKIVYDWLPGQQPIPLFSIQWIDNCLKWANDENSKSRPVIAIKYKALISNIRNRDNWSDWVKKVDPGYRGTENRDGYEQKDDIIW